MLLSKANFQIFRISQDHQLIQSPFPQAEGGRGGWASFRVKAAPYISNLLGGVLRHHHQAGTKGLCAKGSQDRASQAMWGLGGGARKRERLPCC